MNSIHRYLIIVAGGRGVRMGSGEPKQFLLLAGRPVIFHAIDRFLEAEPDIEIIVVLPPGSRDRWKDLCDEYRFATAHHLVEGGAERFDSVKNGLTLVRQKSIVAIHDAVRPLVSTDTIRRCFAVAEEKGNAVPFVRPNDSVREIIDAGNNRALDRKRLALIQTPQVFRSDLILAAYAMAFRPSFTDDASVVEEAGNKINLVEGNPENIKITEPIDLLLAETLWNKR